MEYNIKDIQWGLIAVDPTEPGDELTILHFCGYWQKPTQEDVDNLYTELATDPEFGLTEIADRLEILHAPAYLVQEYVNMAMQDSDDN